MYISPCWYTLVGSKASASIVSHCALCMVLADVSYIGNCDHVTSLVIILTLLEILNIGV